MIANEKERPFKSLNLIFDLAREKLQSQSDHWRAIDQKNAIIIAVYGILLVMVATIDKNSLWIPKCVSGIVFEVWLMLIALGLGCSIASLLPKLMGASANISELSKRFLKAEEYDTKNHLLSAFEDTIIKNEKISNFSISSGTKRHSRENGNPENSQKHWIPAFARMTLIVIISNFQSRQRLLRSYKNNR